MTSWITAIIESVGYLGISGLMFLETYIPPVQTEILMPFAGYASFQGELNLIAVIFAGIVGSELGALSLYGLVRKADSDRAITWIAKNGKWLGINQKKLDSWSSHFDRHSLKTVAIGRLIPGVRSFIAIPAGLQKMPIINFALANLLSAALWITLLSAGGYYLGNDYEETSQYSSYLTYGLTLSIVVYILYASMKKKSS